MSLIDFQLLEMLLTHSRALNTLPPLSIKPIANGNRSADPRKIRG